jgi:hypothetical protein
MIRCAITMPTSSGMNPSIMQAPSSDAASQGICRSGGSLALRVVYRYSGSLQFWPSRNSLGTRSFPQIFCPARLGYLEKWAFLSAK